MLVLPTSQHKQVYYCALITEICKLSASTCGPAVGKTIRKLYSLLNDGLDVEVARKFSEWFSVHMSNFAYQWVWKEWCAVAVDGFGRCATDDRALPGCRIWSSTGTTLGGRLFVGRLNWRSGWGTMTGS